MSFDESLPKRFILALVIGACGGAIALFLNVPLALLLGPLFATLVASLLGAPIEVPPNTRLAIMPILAAFLASEFTPSVVSDIEKWPVSLATVPLYIIVSTLLVAAYFKRFAGLDRSSSIFAAIPGGVAVMAALGGQFGGDERRIALSHVWRIIITVSVVSYILWGLFSIKRNQVDMLTSGLETDFMQVGLVGLLTIIGTILAARLKLPAPHFLGPVSCVAPFYMTGYFTAAIPGFLLALSLWGLGSFIGSRFAGFDHRIVVRMSILSIAAVAIMLMVTLGFAAVLNAIVDIPMVLSILAFSPGGLAEMSMIALALDVDPAFVSIHHLLRIALCIFMAPIVGKWLNQEP